MASDANLPSEHHEGAVEARLRHARALAEGIEAQLAGWVESVVARRWEQWSGREVPDEVRVAARAAGRDAVGAVAPAVREALEADVDEPRPTPLAVLRRAARFPTQVLEGAGVPPVVRDEVAERMFADDIYDLGPASFAAVHPSLHELGIVWGAATAHVHLSRRRGGRSAASRRR